MIFTKDNWHETTGEWLARKVIEFGTLLRATLIAGTLFLGGLGAFGWGTWLISKDPTPMRVILGICFFLLAMVAFWVLAERYLTWKANLKAQAEAALLRESRDD